ncbi:MAG: PTS sugar transporter subunit IIA [Rhabdochlamydiaceae bacterium]
MDISFYLDEHLITFLTASDKYEAVSQLIDKAYECKKINDKVAFFEAIKAREEIVSTGIGLGVAIPHAKLSPSQPFFLGIGVQQGKGIDWGSLDHSLVKIIFIIGGPNNQSTEYLKILSRLTSAIKEESNRIKLLQASSTQEVLSIVSQF